ncbi:Na/Pi cotransporter family protein [Erysipelotrichaceae bacterium Oil+RF-744-GAM-WT-6]|jgi:phosphate:Na+ symporter|uniref:Na/Pi cotransporter family protein n=1 Tax=Stecheria intestinalis TaxID=2606630 RepID=A0A7X2TFF4_9FIRM|nr:Na/Pi cotransporter family protein [Stecheria intestinalis]MCI2153111.1 Na/Pi cotransporter family protein [Solobacterium sp.]MCI6746317.1 Na/Pi cotransporter family protein [Anaerolactibacter massiliensis]MDY4682489.1 Na/Pi cotransporter family protein [Lachnospiraceae bacterium]MDD5880749.1 Na/Pi cotransporter family protein [Stecheria intestinalis]MDD6366541.1 Na/Pi cotransporter family protein [Stecheria intestinalis]
MTLSSISWDMILGGFGLFMFGISFMGSGLKSVAGDQMRDYINKYTASPFSAMLIGIVMTILMQSSSACTAITIGFVRAGLMNLEQAAGIVMGANIGTTVTSFLISMNIDEYAMYIVFAGCMLIVFGKKRKTQYYGDVILGFGLIFYGLRCMGDSLSALKDLPEFSDFALQMSNNSWLSMITGAIMTAVVQASAATIGMVQKLYQANALTLQASLPFMFGANIGTTITGILAAMGGSLGARRTACLHTVFNIFGTLLGMLLLTAYTNLITSLANLWHLNPMMQIAIANMIFNITTTIIFMPFLKQIVGMISKIIPGSEPTRPEVSIDNLDANIGTLLPAAVIEEAEQAIGKMADVVRQDIAETRDFLNKPGTADDRELLDQNEALINRCDKKITEFLVSASVKASFPPQDKENMRMDLEVIKNLERIGDLAMNLTEFFQMVFDDDGMFTPDAIEDINTMFDILLHMYSRAIEIYRTKDRSLFASLEEDENAMDAMEYRSRQAHFDRMSRNECSSAVAASVYCDILGNLERMGDHCCNIARISLSVTAEAAAEA